MDEEMSQRTVAIIVKGVLTALYITAIVFILGYQHWFPILLIIAGLSNFAFWLIRQWVR
jgi:hypothetical protein